MNSLASPFSFCIFLADVKHPKSNPLGETSKVIAEQHKKAKFNTKLQKLILYVDKLDTK